jgi:uncharacterized protein
MRCNYCYLNDHSTDVVELNKIYDFIDKIDNLNNILDSSKPLIIAMSGGNYFLHEDLLDKLFEYIQYKLVVSDHPNKDNWKIELTWNGTFIPEMLFERWHKSINLSISLDGTPAVHDRNRAYKNGKGTSKDVIKNLIFIKNKYPGLICHVNSVITKNNIADLYDSYYFIWNDLEMDFIYSLFDKNINIELSEEELLNFDYQVEKIVKYSNKNNKIWNLSRLMLLDKQKNNFICNGYKITIDLDGNLYPCQLLMNIKSKKIGTINECKLDWDILNEEYLEVNEECSECKVNCNQCSLYSKKIRPMNNCKLWKIIYKWATTQNVYDPKIN